MTDQGIMIESDPYESGYVPFEGKIFTENGQQYYWNFGSVSIGHRVRRNDKAFRTTGRPQIASDGRLKTPGFYFNEPVDREVVEVRDTPVGRIVKWRNNLTTRIGQATADAWGFTLTN